MIKIENKIIHSKEIHLPEIQLEHEWPTLTLEVLALAELEQDPIYSFIPEERVCYYIEQAITFGTNMAKKYASGIELKDVINRLLESKVKINFIDGHMSEWTRAQYVKKPPEIQIFHKSIKQLQQFFADTGYVVPEEDIIKLHLYHEWFHFLEEKICGRTDKLLPRVHVKKWGPIYKKEHIYQTREIAAHAFTQTALGIKWPPLLIDYLLVLIDKGCSKNDIRIYFQKMKHKYSSYVQLKTAHIENNEQDKQDKNDLL